MAQLIYAMSVSLDGFVAGEEGDLEMPPPDAELFRHFTGHVRALAASVYGRRTYEVMRYWDEDRPEWGALERDFAAAWRAHPKWVVSTTLKSAGTNTTLVNGNVDDFVRDLKANLDGHIAVAGPALAGSLTDRGLIDEYRMYVRPFVLGRGKPYFAAGRPLLRLISSDRVGEDAVRIVLAPQSSGVKTR